jgi:hypothetical protein
MNLSHSQLRMISDDRLEQECQCLYARVTAPDVPYDVRRNVRKTLKRIVAECERRKFIVAEVIKVECYRPQNHIRTLTIDPQKEMADYFKAALEERLDAACHTKETGSAFAGKLQEALR